MTNPREEPDGPNPWMDCDGDVWIRKPDKRGPQWYVTGRTQGSYWDAVTEYEPLVELIPKD